MQRGPDNLSLTTPPSPEGRYYAKKKAQAGATSGLEHQEGERSWNHGYDDDNHDYIAQRRALAGAL